ncbi:MAG: PGPGW domain-containing protein [Pseudomonadota bacterium]
MALAPGEKRAAKYSFGSDFAAMLPILHQILGSTLVVTGLIVLPLPLPFGLIMLVIGFALLAPYVPAVRKVVRVMRRKWPKVDAILLRFRDRFPPVIRRTIDKTHPSAPAE